MFFICCNRTGNYVNQVIIGRDFFNPSFVWVSEPCFAWRLRPIEAYSLLSFFEVRYPGRFCVVPAPADDNK